MRLQGAPPLTPCYSLQLIKKHWNQRLLHCLTSYSYNAHKSATKRYPGWTLEPCSNNGSKTPSPTLSAPKRRCFRHIHSQACLYSKAHKINKCYKHSCILPSETGRRQGEWPVERRSPLCFSMSQHCRGDFSFLSQDVTLWEHSSLRCVDGTCIWSFSLRHHGWTPQVVS